MDHPEGLSYTEEHEWVRVEQDVGTIGITNHAQDALGDIVFVDLPEAGSELKSGEQFGTVESVKAVSELFAPVTGEVVEVNADLETEPELVNGDPHGRGWMLRVRLADPAELDRLMSASDYQSFVERD